MLEYPFGLINRGSVCYLNSLLQCIMSYSDFVKIFLTIDDIEKTKKITTSFDLIVKTVIKKSKQVAPFSIFDPIDFKKIILSDKNSFTYGAQEDAEEFLTCLLTMLHEENKFTPTIPNELKSLDPHRNDAILSYIRTYKNNDYSFVTQKFYNQFRKVLKCNKCDKARTHFSVNHHMLLDIHNQSQTLFDLFNEFAEPELLEDYRCDLCKKLNTTYAHSRLSYPPSFLTIVLKKYTRDAHLTSTQFPVHINFSKLNNLILEKDYQSLQEINPLKYGDRDNLAYELKGFLCHFGNLRGGHYIAVVARGDKWYEIDDTNIKEITKITDAHQRAVYMLFYEMVKLN